MAAEGGATAENVNILPRGAIIHTTKGDIWIKLFPEECPKTVENFTTHARNGYYDNIFFHRIIKGFMLQTGDPLGEQLRLKSSHRESHAFCHQSNHSSSISVLSLLLLM